MILIADSGSTKAEWVVVKDGTPGDSFFTSGISPIYLNETGILEVLKKELPALSGQSFSEVYFYGSGCNSEDNNNIVKRAVGKFVKADSVFVGSDVLAAAVSLCFNREGIACILGTGSNSCYYNGKEIVYNVPPLGYILGDEGSAAVMGKKLVSDILKKQLPEGVRTLFFETYKTTTAEIIENVYRTPFPSRYLGKFARFLSSNIEIPELYSIVESSLDDFIVRNILQYPESAFCKINFTGSIAYNFKIILEKGLSRHSLNSGIITLAPMKNLVKYHIEFSYPNHNG
jgi:glucosamine kinase